MSDQPPGDPGAPDPAGPADLTGQLRAVVERVNAIASWVPGVEQLERAVGGAVPELPELPHLPAPGALTATQVAAVASAVRAQRTTIEATRATLDAFEQQLLVLEELLGPFETFSRAWAELEQRLPH